MTADEDTVEELLTLYTIRSKMQKAIEAEADTNVTDEEANERGYTMMTISTTSHQDDSGNTVEYTDDEKKQLKETANKIEDAVKNGKTLEDAAKDEDQQTTTGAYASDDSTLDTSVKKALDDLKEGETSDVIETDSALYIVRLDSETDKDATEKIVRILLTNVKVTTTMKCWRAGRKKTAGRSIKRMLQRFHLRIL